MNFLRTRLEHLVEHLRERIVCGELNNPLPNTRQWARELGVSRTTLTTALQVLQKQRLVTIHPRHGVQLRAVRRSGPAPLTESHRLVRALYYAHDYPDLETDMAMWFMSFAERLHRLGIQLILQRCHAGRFQRLARRGPQSHEMILLLSVPERFQELFEGWPSALLAGHPAHGSALPFVTADLESSVRHATLTLLRHGHRTINLLTDKGGSPGVAQAIEIFQSTCAQWRRQPVHGTAVRMSLEVEELVGHTARLANAIEPPHGIIVVDPVPLEVLLAALLARGLDVPGQIEVIAVNSTPAVAESSPSVSHYPFPTASLVRTLIDTAVIYFNSGAVPPLRRSILIEKVRSPRHRAGSGRLVAEN